MNDLNMRGYLEKKSKLKFCNWWRKMYFILEGKTLMCTKSKEDYENDKSTAKIVVHFAKVNGVRQVSSSHNASGRFQFEIITKGTSIVLSSTDEVSRSRWLSALQDSLKQSDISSPLDRKMQPIASTQSLQNMSPSTFYLDGKPSARQRDHSNSNPDIFCCRDRLNSESTISTCSQEFTSPSVTPQQVQVHNHAEIDQQINTPATHPQMLQHQNVVVERFPKVGAVTQRNCEVTPTTSNPQTVVLRDCQKLKMLSLPVSINRPSSSLVWRKSEVEFFWSDKNADWPALSMDLCDELLEEIRNGGQFISSPVELKDMNTQTDFQDDQDFLQTLHACNIRDELISFISTSSSSANVTPTTEEREIPAASEGFCGGTADSSSWSIVDEEGEQLDTDYDFISASESCYVTAESSDGEL